MSCVLGCPLHVGVMNGSEVMSVLIPCEPALVDTVNCVTVQSNRQTPHAEPLNLSQCQIKVTGMPLHCIY